MAVDDKGYFEQTYEAPFKGIHTLLPENKIPKEHSPFIDNFILKSGEFRTRPRYKQVIPSPGDHSTIDGVTAFIDSNNVTHTVAITRTGLWQLNSQWRIHKKKAWNLVGIYPKGAFPGPDLPITFQVFLDKLYFTQGSNYLWQWDGITNPSVANPSAFKSVAIIDQAHNLNAGAFYMGELDFRLILLNTVEQVRDGVSGAVSVQSFPQRVRWCASGLPTQWDSTVNIGAGFNDEFDVPDTITGFLTIGRTGFIFRGNGITELTSISKGVLPFDWNHLWASERGIGNVFPYSIAGYGPIGIFISTDDVYRLSLGGFERVGGVARDFIMDDLSKAASSPIASMFPSFNTNYVYLVYHLSIPMSATESIIWVFSNEDESWSRWTIKGTFQTGKIRLNPSF
jgi:hypothetical protein